ncbi:MAG: hypothetical protein HZB71_11325 [Betaproteobacteria bacterium]|nr:hypothetical protein [Betaproteobacteria bacterium]
MSDTWRYKLSVRLLEDLHTGSGTGAGDIDALLMRDRRGRPIIRSSHLKGILLATAEEYLQLVEAHVVVDLKKDIKELLGDEGGKRGRLQMTSLRWSGGSGATIVWTSSARTPGSRTPKNDTMRMVEHVAAGNTFSCEMRLTADARLNDLLKKLVARTDRLGGGRNRGGGLVQIELGEASSDEPTEPHGQGKRLRLRLRNLDPLCLPDTAHPGNLIASHSFIRGQALRGALMAWALGHGNANVRKALQAASVGDAIPLPEGWTEETLTQIDVLPIPLSILTPKPEGGRDDLPWWALGGARPQPFDDIVPGSQPCNLSDKPKRPGAREYLAQNRSDGLWHRYSPAMAVHMRHQTPDRSSSGSPGANSEPNLFSVEELAEDTDFLAEIRFENAPNAARFAELFQPVLGAGEWLPIGRGGRPVQIVQATLMEPRKAGPSGDAWTLTLVSDLLLRGDDLGFLTDLSIPHLCDQAKIPLQQGWNIQGHVETVALHGFNAASGLRRVGAIALRRGSCWRISGEGCRVLAAALAEKDALGERTHEGLGRFVIDAQPMTQIGAPQAKTAPPQVNTMEALLGKAQKLARLPGASNPSLSQLQSLRNDALACRNEADMENLFGLYERAGKKLGGKAWFEFPLDKLKKAISQLNALEEKRLLISYMVQWIASNKVKGERS